MQTRKQYLQTLHAYLLRFTTSLDCSQCQTHQDLFLQLKSFQFKRDRTSVMDLQSSTLEHFALEVVTVRLILDYRHCMGTWNPSDMCDANGGTAASDSRKTFKPLETLRIGAEHRCH